MAKEDLELRLWKYNQIGWDNLTGDQKYDYRQIVEALSQVAPLPEEEPDIDRTALAQLQNEEVWDERDATHKALTNQQFEQDLKDLNQWIEQTSLVTPAIQQGLKEFQESTNWGTSIEEVRARQLATAEYYRKLRNNYLSYVARKARAECNKPYSKLTYTQALQQTQQEVEKEISRQASLSVSNLNDRPITPIIETSANQIAHAVTKNLRITNSAAFEEVLAVSIANGMVNPESESDILGLLDLHLNKPSKEEVNKAAEIVSRHSQDPTSPIPSPVDTSGPDYTPTELSEKQSAYLASISSTISDTKNAEALKTLENFNKANIGDAKFFQDPVFTVTAKRQAEVEAALIELAKTSNNNSNALGGAFVRLGAASNDPQLSGFVTQADILLNVANSPHGLPSADDIQKAINTSGTRLNSLARKNPKFYENLVLNRRAAEQGGDIIACGNTTRLHIPFRNRNFYSSLEQHSGGGGYFSLSSHFSPMVGRMSSFRQSGFGRGIDTILHPEKKILSILGKKIGKQITNFALKTVGKKLAKTLLVEGLKRGIGMAVGAIAGVMTGGLSLLLQGLNMIKDLLLKVFKNLLNDITTEIFGEPIKKREVIQALVLGTSAVLLAITAGAFAITISPAIIGGIVGGYLFFHIPILNMGTILSTMVPLESGVGYYASASGSYNGPVIPGCHPIWPVEHGYIVQGPLGTYSHATNALQAIDIIVPIGTPVYSVSDGVVTFTGTTDGYGNQINIQSSKNGQNYTVLYGHLSVFNVHTGETVKQGQQIALSGNTSNVAAFANPHLHLEYRGLQYNQCPAANTRVNNGCSDFSSCGKQKW